MSIWIHTTIVATSLVATIAIAAAAVTLYDNPASVAAAKGDRLPVAHEMTADARYVTIESRGDGVSVLQRVPVTLTAAN